MSALVDVEGLLRIVNVFFFLFLLFASPNLSLPNLASVDRHVTTLVISCITSIPHSFLHKSMRIQVQKERFVS